MGERAVLILSIIVFNLIVLAFIIGLFLFIREYRAKKKKHLEELSFKDIAHQQELLTTQLEIQKETMGQIGREIHDNVGQKLTLSSLYLLQIDATQSASDMLQSILAVNDILNDSLKDLRQLSQSLTSDKIKANTIEDLIQEECASLNQLKACEIAFTNNLAITIDAYQTKSVLLRVTQEFLQNSIKHSKCKRINLHLTNDKRHLSLVLEDDGIGFNPKKLANPGIGLSNMRKRIEIIGGDFKLQSSKNKGTSLQITIPIL